MAGDADLRPEDWGKHLRADYRHDGLDPSTHYNLGRATPAAKAPNGNEFDEDSFMKYALNLDYIQNDATFKARMASRMEFKLPTKTAEFDGTAPQLFDAGNLAIALVMDAGKYVTDYLGAQNDISFGMCVDPAGSSIGKNDKPVYYEPPAGNESVYVDLKQFGFDPAVIRGIWIVKVLGGSIVKSVWVMGDGTRIDPVSRKRFPGKIDAASAHVKGVALAGVDVATLGGKVINQTDPEKAGYYTSIANATDASAKPSEQDFYKMGKTLGDTMIVASAMKEFKLYNADGSVSKYPNPYYGVGNDAGWKNHFNPANDYPYPGKPSTALVKTGDRLNAVRAIFKGVPVILERQAKGNKPKFFEFYPGTPAPEQVIGAITPGYTRLITECGRRYDELIANMRPLVVGGRLTSDAAKFSGEKRAARFVLDEAKSTAAGTFVTNVIDGLARLKSASVAYLTAKKAEAEAMIAALPQPLAMDSIEGIKNTYSKHTQEMLLLSPQTTVVVENYLTKPIIVVTRTGDAGIGGVRNTEIHLLGAVTAIAENNPDVLVAINERFANRIPEAPVVPVTPEQRAGLLEILKTTMSAWVLSIFTRFAGAPQAGGAIGDAMQRRWAEVSADVVPVTVAFVNYLKDRGIGADTEGRLNAIYLVLRMSELDEFTDPHIVAALRREFVQLKYIRYVDFPTVTVENREEIPSDQPITTACFVINAFAAHINANNAEELGGSDELVEIFRSIESDFLLGGGPPAAPSAEMALGESGAAVAPPGGEPPEEPAVVPESVAAPVRPPVVPSLTFGAPGGEAPRLYPEVVKTGVSPLGKPLVTASKTAKRGEEARTAALEKARQKYRAALMTQRRTPQLRAGRRRTFRQKRTKKDKNAAGTA